MSVFFYICDYFQIEPKDFFDIPNNYPEQLNQIINDLKFLNIEQLHDLAPIIKALKKNT